MRASFTSAYGANRNAVTFLAVAIFELGLAGFFLFMGFSAPYGVNGGLVLTAGILGVIGILCLVIGIISLQRKVTIDRINDSGITGTATVTNVTQYSMYVNGNPMLKMTLDVNVPGQPRYTATRTEVVPMILLSRVTSGARLPVKVDPQNQKNVVIQW